MELRAQETSPEDLLEIPEARGFAGRLLLTSPVGSGSNMGTRNGSVVKGNEDYSRRLSVVAEFEP